MTEAKTQNLIFSVRIARFYELDNELEKRIVNSVNALITNIGKENEFIVFNTSMINTD